MIALDYSNVHEKSYQFLGDGIFFIEGEVFYCAEDHRVCDDGGM